MSLYNLFSVPIWNTELDTIDNEEIVKHCQKIKKEQSQGRNISNVGGWQSDILMGPHHQPIYEFHKKLNNAVSQFCTDINIQQPIKTQGIWMNINGYKDYNKIHSHSWCQISGVYYAQVTENTGDIHFRHPAVQAMNCDWDKTKVRWYEDSDGNTGRFFNQYNSAVWNYKPVVGQLLLFPSWLEHYTSPNLEKDIERVSLSFNYYTTETYGD